MFLFTRKITKILGLRNCLCINRCFFVLEQYEKAVEDFNECLKIQKANLEPDSRLLAETYPFMS